MKSNTPLYVRLVGHDTWHWRPECFHVRRWVTFGALRLLVQGRISVTLARMFTVSKTTPMSGELCNSCQRHERIAKEAA